MAGPGVLGNVWRVYREPDPQQIPVRVLRFADGHLRVQLRVRVSGPVQAGTLVRRVLVGHGGHVHPGAGVHHVPVPGHHHGPVRAQSVPLQGDGRGVRGVRGRVDSRTPEPRRVLSGRGRPVPGYHPAVKRLPAVLPVHAGAPVRHVAAGLLSVHLRAEPEHVLHRDTVRYPVFRGARPVPGHQRRPGAVERREPRSRQVSVHGGPAASASATAAVVVVDNAEPLGRRHIAAAAAA